jgi:hypothetical protein
MHSLLYTTDHSLFNWLALEIVDQGLVVSVEGLGAADHVHSLLHYLALSIKLLPQDAESGSLLVHLSEEPSSLQVLGQIL